MQAMRIILIFLAVTIIAISLAAADMPSSFYQAMSNMKNQETLCVKNYDAGASITESYTDFEHLEKETEVVSRSYNTSNNEMDTTRGNASLEAHLDASVIGNSHIAWQSKDLMPDHMGRHAIYSHVTDDTTGVFNIEKFIQLWSNSSLGSVSLEWLPCG
jgi:hypothetical protein